MAEERLDLAPPVALPKWGDREPPWIPDTVGNRAKAAEAVWKIDADPRFPDSVLDEGAVGDVTVMACAVRGAKHRYEGSSREDAAMATSAAGAWALAAVADGVGSVPDSRKASELAVQTFTTELSRRLELFGPDSVGHGEGLFKAVNFALERLGGPKTTLTAAAVAAQPDEQGRYPFWVARVGDSPAYVIRDGELQPLFESEREDEFATTTAAMPTRELRRHFRPRNGHLLPGEALMLASDGIGDLMIAEKARHYFASKWSEVPSPVDFMRQVQVRSRTFDDDRSAAVLWAAPDRNGAAPNALRPSAQALPDHPTARDIEVRAAKVRGIEVRAVARRGPVAAAAGRPRTARVALADHSDKLVAIAACESGSGEDTGVADLWTRTLLEYVGRFPPDYPSQGWPSVVWTHALRSLAEEDFDPRLLSSALVCAEPAANGGVLYTVGVAGPLTVSVVGAGLDVELADMREPDDRYGDRSGTMELLVYIDRLEDDQALLVRGGTDGAGLVREMRAKPGPLQTLGVLEPDGGASDLLAVAMWGER